MPPGWMCSSGGKGKIIRGIPSGMWGENVRQGSSDQVLSPVALIPDGMKAIVCAGILLLLAVVLTCGCTTAPIQGGTATPVTPDLAGNWSGTWKNYTEGTGYSDGAGYRMTMSVTEQQDRIFSGELYFFRPDGSTVIYTFAGAIDPNGTTFTLVEENGGYCSGTYSAPDTIELIYVNDASPYTIAIDSLKKS
jgi:hypothetical protein